MPISRSTQIMNPDYTPMFSPSHFGSHPYSSTPQTTPLVQEKQTGVRKKAKWNETEHCIFVTACETVIADGHRQGKCFTKHGWEKLIYLFNTASGHNWNKTQLKNRWDAMRREHTRVVQLLRCTGVEYNTSTNMIVTDNDWWDRKIKENPANKEFRGKDCREVYIRYHGLFGDTYDGDQFAMTPTKLSRTGFGVLDDDASEDSCDRVPGHDEGSGSSDEAVKEKGKSNMEMSGLRSGDKRKSSSDRKGKKKKVSARELSYSVEKLTTFGEEVVAKTRDALCAPGADPNTCVKELLSTGKLEKKSKLYYFALTFLTHRRNREMFAVIEDLDDKYEWIEYRFNNFMK